MQGKRENVRCGSMPNNSVSASSLHSGVLLVGHGTRDAAGAAEFNVLTERLRQEVGSQPVEGCFLELRPPTIADAWRRLVEVGARHIHVAPLLLFSAGHAKRDIPRAIERCAAETPGITHDFARPLSRHPRLIELAVERALQAWRKSSLSVASSSANRVALVIVGRGSYDPCAQADMRLLTEIVGRRLPFGQVETAFYAMASPSLPELLDRVARSANVRMVIVQPHLLFQGAILDAIRRHIGEAGERHRHLAFLTSTHLGPDTRIAAAIAARAENPLATKFAAS